MPRDLDFHGAAMLVRGRYLENFATAVSDFRSDVTTATHSRHFFFGRFVASDDGTLIEGEFRMHPFVRIFMIVWFSFLGVSSVIMLISVFAGQADVQDSPILGLVIPAGMVAFGVALVK